VTIENAPTAASPRTIAEAPTAPVPTTERPTVDLPVVGDGDAMASTERPTKEIPVVVPGNASGAPVAEADGTVTAKLETPLGGTNEKAAAKQVIKEVAGEGKPLVFGDEDLVYGPSANTALQKLQQQAGGQLLTSMKKPEELSWEQFSEIAMEGCRASGNRIHFDLTHMRDLEKVLAGDAFVGKVTTHELLYLRTHWGRFSGTVIFYRNGVETDPPW
jgi:hypothetical protein